MDYVNVPYSIAFAITSGFASLHDLQTVYGIEDLWDLIEIHAVNCFNEAHAAHTVRG
ncbi:transcription elongation factor GreA [Paraburkholderia aspalathi]|nr:transcription elongation factor GreA [Paraburkholderia aspalathi]